MGRRAGLLAAAIMMALATTGGVALADNVQGDASGNRLTGTAGKDNISGAGGGDDIFGRDGQDRLFGDAGNDDVSGGDGRDRLQGGTGQDALFGQQGNDLVDCGQGDMDVAGIDAFGIFIPVEATDEVAPNCELLYVGIPFGPVSQESRAGSGPDLSSFDARAEAEQAEADGLLRQIR